MNQTTEKSGLDVSVYTNYIVNNCIREHIELKNEVKTKGVIFDKNRYAILTSHRFLVFAHREAYLNKKKPRKEFNLTDHDFVVDSDTIQILKEGNVLKEYIFPTIEIAVHWWESILQLKRAPKVEEEGTNFNGFNQDISRIGKSNQQQDGRGSTSTMFTTSVMYEIDGFGPSDNNNKGGGFGELLKEETERTKKRKQLRQPVKKKAVSKVPEDKKSETSAKFPTEGNENNKQVPKDNTNNNNEDENDNEEEEGELNKSRIGKGKNNDDDDNNDNDLNNKEPCKDIIGKDRNNNDNSNNKPNNININFNNDKQSNNNKEPIKHVTNNYIILKSAYSPTEKEKEKEKPNDKNSNNNDNNSKHSNNENNPETKNDNNNNNSKSNNDNIPQNEPSVISSVISNNEPNKQIMKPKDNSSPFINNSQPLIQPKSLHYINASHPHYESQHSQNNSIHFHNDNTEPKTNHPQNDFNNKPTDNNNNVQDNNQPFMNNTDDNFFPLKSIHSTQSKFSTNSLNKTSSIFKKVITPITPSNSSSIPTQNVIGNNNNNNNNNSSIRFSSLLETEGNLNTISIIPKQKDLSPNGSLSNEIVPTQENLTIKEVPEFKTKIDLLEKEEPSIRLISNNNNNNNDNNKPDHKKLILEQYFNTPNNNNIFPSTITPIKVIKKGKNKLYPITHCFYIEHDDDEDENDINSKDNNTKPKEEMKENPNKNSRKKKKRKNRKNKSVSYSNNNSNNDDHLNNSNVFYKDINIENDITPTKRTQEQPKTLRTKPKNNNNINETPLTLKRNSSTIGTQTDIKYNDDIQNSIDNESNDYDKINDVKRSVLE